ncbi:MAG: hypothetical protein ABUS49_06515 [Acidobacteriota bacterium]
MRLTVLLAAILVCSGLACSAGPGAAETIFPADGTRPALPGDQELLKIVCPAGAALGDRGVTCPASCPAFTGLPGEGFEWSFGAITRGHFLAPASEDAIVAASGCEPESLNSGGTFLLTRRSGAWTLLWYKAGVDTARCHKVMLPSGREILTCLGETGLPGEPVTSLYMEDPLHPTPVLRAGDGSEFFSTRDNTATCGWNNDDESKPYPLVYSRVGKIEFGSGRGRGRPVLSVTATFGEKPMTREDAQWCIDEENPAKPHRGAGFLPQAKRYKIDFLFTGKTYRVAPSSQGSALIFSRR